MRTIIWRRPNGGRPASIHRVDDAAIIRPPWSTTMLRLPALGVTQVQGTSFSALPGAVFTIFARVAPLVVSMTVTISPTLS